MFTLTLESAKNALSKLPIAYYLKSKTLKVEISETEQTSYINLRDDKITIAYNNLVEASKKLNNQVNSEIIRGLLYHEVSHAIYTPLDILPYLPYKRLTANLFNILEDERIETLNAHYFMNTNFENNKNLMLTPANPPQTFEQYAFNVIRFHETNGHDDLIVKLYDFIKQTCKVTSQHRQLTTTAKNGKVVKATNYCLLTIKSEEYINEIWKVWDKIQKQQQKQESQDNQENKQKKSRKPSAKQLQKAKEMQEQIEQMQEQIEQNKATMEEVASDGANSQISYENCDVQMPLTSYYEPISDLYVKLVKTITKRRGVGVEMSPSSIGYSGDFDPELKMLDFGNTKKWFRDDDDFGELDNNKAKLTLNIFLDNSNSFYNNDFKTSRILATLAKLESKRNDFQFNVIRVENQLTLLPKERRTSHSNGCTYIRERELNEVCKKVLNPQCFNIVLFDGAIGENAISNLSKKLNTRNTAIITPSDEKCYFDAHLPNTRRIYENNNYTERLEDNIITALQNLF